MINYRSLADLGATIQRNLFRIPRDIDLVVGVPRSGLLAANILSLNLHRPLTDVEGLIAGRLLGSGMRTEWSETMLDASRRLKVFVLDNSIHSGREMARVRERLESASLPHEIIYGAVYALPESRQLVDFHFEVVPQVRVFQWNLMHHCLLDQCCVDIDGVLCRNPTKDENDDGPQYEDFLKNVAPNFVPATPIGWLVTCRLEKYRHLTEHWLHQHGIVYRHLVMMDLPSKAARLASGSHGSFKAKVFAETNAALFIESSASQAYEIAAATGKQVFCLETARMESFELPSLAHVPRQEQEIIKSTQQTQTLLNLAVQREQRVQDLTSQLAERDRELAAIKNSKAWKAALLLRRLRTILWPGRKGASPPSCKPVCSKPRPRINPTGPRKLEIGPGEHRVEGFETLNIVPGDEVDYVADATKPLPFDAETFDLIYASHILEHVAWYQLDAVLAEWTRILKTGGWLEIWVPDGLKSARHLWTRNCTTIITRIWTAGIALIPRKIAASGPPGECSPTATAPGGPIAPIGIDRSSPGDTCRRC